MVTVPFSENQLAARNQALMQLIDVIVIGIFVFIILFALGTVTGVLLPPIDPTKPDNPFLRKLWYPVYGLAIAISLPKLPQVFRMATFSPLIIICVLYCGISMLWSIDPGVTFRRVIALTLTTYVGLALAAWFDWRRMVQVVALAFLITAIATAGLALLDPAKGVMQDIHAGAWKGPFAEKNQMGGRMTLGFIACISAFALRPSRAWFWVPAAGLCFLMVIMSTSKTALLITLLSICIFVFLKVYRTSPFTRIPLIFGLFTSVGLMALLITVFPDFMFGLIGKDASLTGRTDIWAMLTDAINKEFWTGYGFGVFWQDPYGPSYIIKEVLQWPVPTAHNGWIEIWLSAGVGIVFLFALQCFLAFGFALFTIRYGGRETYWIVLVLISYIGFSMSESEILQQNNVFWIIFVATCAKLFSAERSYRPLRY